MTPIEKLLIMWLLMSVVIFFGGFLWYHFTAQQAKDIPDVMADFEKERKWVQKQIISNCTTLQEETVNAIVFRFQSRWQQVIKNTKNKRAKKYMEAKIFELVEQLKMKNNEQLEYNF